MKENTLCKRCFNTVCICRNCATQEENLCTTTACSFIIDSVFCPGYDDHCDINYRHMWE